MTPKNLPGRPSRLTFPLRIVKAQLGAPHCFGPYVLENAKIGKYSVAFHS